MKKCIFSFVILTVIFLVMVNIGFSLSNQYSSKLLPLVGQKVNIALMNGEFESGTLWDFGNDYITVKVKKGLVYSKAVKYGLSEIQYLEDLQGNRLKFSDTNAVNKKPKAIFFNVDDTEAVNAGETGPQTEQENSLQIVARARETTQNTVENEGQSNNSIKAANTLEAEQKTKIIPVYRTRNAENSPVPLKMAEAVRVEEQEISNKSTATAAIHENWPKQVQVIQPQTQPQPETLQPEAVQLTTENSEIQGDELLENEENVEIAALPGVNTQLQPHEGTGATAAKEVLVLRYQLLILFGVVGFVAIVMLTAKLVGIKGATYGKHSLFPTRLMKLDGKYGVIDQGSDEGVKIDDIIRFYRKDGRKIEYHGLVKVKKVENNYSAVEILKTKKRVSLEIGDVGFRDRNFIATTMKKLRILTSIFLNLLGKVILFTAKNLEVKETPTIDLNEINESIDNPNSKAIANVKVVNVPLKSSTKKKTATANNSVKNGKSVGFGVAKS